MGPDLARRALQKLWGPVCPQPSAAPAGLRRTSPDLGVPAWKMGQQSPPGCQEVTGEEAQPSLCARSLSSSIAFLSLRARHECVTVTRLVREQRMVSTVWGQFYAVKAIRAGRPSHSSQGPGPPAPAWEQTLAAGRCCVHTSDTGTPGPVLPRVGEDELGLQDPDGAECSSPNISARGGLCLHVAPPLTAVTAVPRVLEAVSGEGLTSGALTTPQARAGEHGHGEASSRWGQPGRCQPPGTLCGEGAGSKGRRGLPSEPDR